MLASKIIFGIYSLIIAGIKNIYNFLTDMPNFYNNSLAKIKNYTNDFKYRIRNLSEANFELGLHHLNKLNINDAIIRFKLIDLFFNKGDKKANYWLGWCYFLKNKPEIAIDYLQKAYEFDITHLRDFIQNYRNYSEIPEKILQQYRDFIIGSDNYYNRFYNDKLYLPTIFTQKVLDKITDLPDEYDILEISSDVGLMGIEIRKRFPDNLSLTGIEISSKMIEIASLNNQAYDELLNVSLQNFVFKYSETKFDVILSLFGLNFMKDFQSYLTLVSQILNDNGYFAFGLQMFNGNSSLLKSKQYDYNIEEITKLLKLNKFNLLGFDELKLGINNKYYIYICRKN